jgi:uncharacterized protein
MSVGLTNRLNILQQSPHDLEPAAEETESTPKRTEWVPSRYTMRARTTDGRLVLWNSFTGAISVFRADQAGDIVGMLSRSGFESEPEGIVKYLADRGFLIKKGTDEYALFQLAFGQRQHRSDLLELILLSSEDCNFRCVYCYEKFTRGTMRPEIREGIKKYVAKRLSGLRALNIGWFGGEPLYGFPAIEDLAPFFRQAAEDHSLHFASHMTTNGYLLTPEVGEKLLTWGVNQFQITLDGPAVCHNHSRPTRNGEGTFDVILDNLRALAKRPESFHVDLRVNFAPPSVPHMPQFLDLIGEEFKDDARFRMRFHAVGKWGGTKDDELEVCGIDDANRLALDFERAAQDKGLILADGFKTLSTLGSQVCYAARPYHFVIGASGKVMKCTVVLDTDERNIVGSITPEGDLRVDQSLLAPWVAPYFEQDNHCQRCVLLPECQGFSCPLPRITQGERPCIPTRANWKKALVLSVEKTKPTRRRIVEQPTNAG